jgi:NADP-dependent 3-hydroxy acid dehydrogenase YdfG
VNDLKGKVVIVTGASSGIGQATAAHLASLGAKVVLGARRTDRLQATAARIGPAAIWKAGDVSVLGDQQALVRHALDHFGRVDALINNAGLMPVSPIALGCVDDWNRMIDVNVKGVLYGIHAVLGHMLERGSGSIVNMASVAARSAGAGGAVYSATKAAVSMLSEGLRKETAGKIRVCVIYPGLTESELVESVTNAAIREFARSLYVNAIPAQAIAEAVAYALTQPGSVSVNEITVRPLANQEI